MSMLWLLLAQGQKPESMNLIDVCEVYEIVELCIDNDKSKRYALPCALLSSLVSTYSLLTHLLVQYTSIRLRVHVCEHSAIVGARSLG